MNVQIESIANKFKEEKDIIAKAELLHSLKYEYDMRGFEISQKLQIQESYISNVLRILHLPDLIRDGYYSHIVTATHLLLIARLKDEEQMTALYENILTNNLTVQQTEEYVREKISTVKTDGNKISKEIIDQFSNEIKKIDENIEVKVIQSQIQANIQIKLKGNRVYTSEMLGKIIQRYLNK